MRIVLVHHIRERDGERECVCVCEKEREIERDGETASNPCDFSRYNCTAFKDLKPLNYGSIFSLSFF